MPLLTMLMPMLMLMLVPMLMLLKRGWIDTCRSHHNGMLLLMHLLVAGIDVGVVTDSGAVDTGQHRLSFSSLPTFTSSRFAGCGLAKPIQFQLPFFCFLWGGRGGGSDGNGVVIGSCRIRER